MWLWGGVAVRGRGWEGAWLFKINPSAHYWYHWWINIFNFCKGFSIILWTLFCWAQKFIPEIAFFFFFFFIFSILNFNVVHCASNRMFSRHDWACRSHETHYKLSWRHCVIVPVVKRRAVLKGLISVKNSHGSRRAKCDA